MPKHRASESPDFIDPQQPPLVIGLLRAWNWLDESIRLMQQARGFDALTRPQRKLLVHVAAGERRAVRIARKLGVARQTVSTLVNELVELGVLTVEPDPEDARAQLLAFSAQGVAQGPDMVEMSRQLEAYLGTLIGEDRLHVLRHALTMDWGEPRAVGSDMAKAADTDTDADDDTAQAPRTGR